MRDAQSLLDRLISYGGNKIQDEEITEVLGLIDQKMLSDTIDAIAGRMRVGVSRSSNRSINLDTTFSTSVGNSSSLSATSSS